MKTPMAITMAVAAVVLTGGGFWYFEADRQARSLPVLAVPQEPSVFVQASLPETHVGKLIQANHRLAAKLYGKLDSSSEEDENFIFAPGNVVATLATILTAEKGDAEQELRQVLEVKADREKLKSAITELAAQLRRDLTTSEEVFLGLRIEDSGKDGVVVKQLVPDSLAANAGFRQGDRIVSIRLGDGPGKGLPIKSAADFVHAIDVAPALVRVRCLPASEERYVTRRLRLIGQKKVATTPERELQLRTMDVLWHAADDTPPGSLLEFAEEARGVFAQPIDFAKDAKRVRLWFGKRLRPEREITLTSKALPADLRTAFTSVLYFQPAWTDAVRPGPVREIAFHVGERKPKVPVIPFTGRFHVHKTADYQSVELPCAGSVAVVFVVPIRSDGLGTVEKSLTVASWPKLMGAGTVQDATLVVPEFDLVGRNNFSQALAKLGLATSFAPDRTELKKGKLAPTTLLQQVQARVLRQESSGAAPTEAALRIVADRGFLFMVYDRRTQEILILGRLVDPRAV